MRNFSHNPDMHYLPEGQDHPLHHPQFTPQMGFQHAMNRTRGVHESNHFHHFMRHSSNLPMPGSMGHSPHVTPYPVYDTRFNRRPPMYGMHHSPFRLSVQPGQPGYAPKSGPYMSLQPWEAPPVGQYSSAYPSVPTSYTVGPAGYLAPPMLEPYRPPVSYNLQYVAGMGLASGVPDGLSDYPSVQQRMIASLPYPLPGIPRITAMPRTVSAYETRSNGDYRFRYTTYPGVIRYDSTNASALETAALSPSAPDNYAVPEGYSMVTPPRTIQRSFRTPDGSFYQRWKTLPGVVRRDPTYVDPVYRAMDSVLPPLQLRPSGSVPILDTIQAQRQMGEFMLSSSLLQQELRKLSVDATRDTKIAPYIPTIAALETSLQYIIGSATNMPVAQSTLNELQHVANAWMQICTALQRARPSIPPILPLRGAATQTPVLPVRPEYNLPATPEIVHSVGYIDFGTEAPVAFTLTINGTVIEVAPTQLPGYGKANSDPRGFTITRSPRGPNIYDITFSKSGQNRISAPLRANISTHIETR